MLLIAEELDEFLHVDGLSVGIQVSLAVQSSVVHQVVGIGNYSTD